MLTRLISLKCEIEDLTLTLREQEKALLHADRQIVGKVFVGHFRVLQVRHIVFNKIILLVGLALMKANCVHLTTI